MLFLDGFWTDLEVGAGTHRLSIRVQIFQWRWLWVMYTTGIQFVYAKLGYLLMKITSFHSERGSGYRVFGVHLWLEIL